MTPTRTRIRAILGIERPPDGIAGLRDADAPCHQFVPGAPAGDRCMGDGHYLCGECVLWAGRGYDDRGEAVYAWETDECPVSAT